MKPIAKEPNLKTEAVAGITTFFTMAYIVIVNPSILSTEGRNYTIEPRKDKASKSR